MARDAVMMSIGTPGVKYDFKAFKFIPDTDPETSKLFWSYLSKGLVDVRRGFVSDAPIITTAPTYDDVLFFEQPNSLSTITEVGDFPDSKGRMSATLNKTHARQVVDLRQGVYANHLNWTRHLPTIDTLTFLPSGKAVVVSRVAPHCNTPSSTVNNATVFAASTLVFAAYVTSTSNSVWDWDRVVCVYLRELASPMGTTAPHHPFHAVLPPGGQRFVGAFAVSTGTMVAPVDPVVIGVQYNPLRTKTAWRPMQLWTPDVHGSTVVVLDLSAHLLSSTGLVVRPPVEPPHNVSAEPPAPPKAAAAPTATPLPPVSPGPRAHPPATPVPEFVRDPDSAGAVWWPQDGSVSPTGETFRATLAHDPSSALYGTPNATAYPAATTSALQITSVRVRVPDRGHPPALMLSIAASQEHVGKTLTLRWGGAGHAAVSWSLKALTAIAGDGSGDGAGAGALTADTLTPVEPEPVPAVSAPSAPPATISTVTTTVVVHLTNDMMAATSAVWLGGQRYGSGSAYAATVMDYRFVRGVPVYFGSCAGTDWVTPGVQAEGLCVINDNMTAAWMYSRAPSSYTPTFVAGAAEGSAFGSLDGLVPAAATPGVFQFPGVTVPSRAVGYFVIGRTGLAEGAAPSDLYPMDYSHLADDASFGVPGIVFVCFFGAVILVGVVAGVVALVTRKKKVLVEDDLLKTSSINPASPPPASNYDIDHGDVEIAI